MFLRVPHRCRWDRARPATMSPSCLRHQPCSRQRQWRHPSRRSQTSDQPGTSTQPNHRPGTQPQPNHQSGTRPQPNHQSATQPQPNRHRASPAGQPRTRLPRPPLLAVSYRSRGPVNSTEPVWSTDPLGTAEPAGSPQLAGQAGSLLPAQPLPGWPRRRTHRPRGRSAGTRRSPPRAPGSVACWSRSDTPID